MVKWSNLFRGTGDSERHYERHRLLPAHTHDVHASAIPPQEVTKVALRLKYQIERIIPFELEEYAITRANSAVITPKVVQTAKEAGGGEEGYRACTVYCLLVCRKWFITQSSLELWDSGLHDIRATACEVIAKRIIEEEYDQDFLLHELLLKRFSVIRDGKETVPSNVLEKAVDLHALRVISSSGYQKAMNYLWRGWIVQSEQEPGVFIDWKSKDNLSYWAHFDPNRMRTPLYQNVVHVVFALIFLILYTIAVNTINEDGDLDVIEAILYVMTLGYICDEIAKFWKVGRNYFGFWNAFHVVLYAILTTSFVIRMVAIAQSSDPDNDHRKHFNKIGYHFFAASAPMVWARLLLYLDGFRFFGTMMIVVKVMMRESFIFFALLILICVGFLQAFVGFKGASGGHQFRQIDLTVIRAMVNAVMQSPSFGSFKDYASPFGEIMYYIYVFIVMVILLNILVALFNAAYSNITDNAADEYMSLFAQKTISYVRAPDENVFIAPFNLIELLFLILPFEWWLNSARYESLNTAIMGIIYSPILLITSFIEVREARTVRSNRSRGEADDDTIEEWEQMNESNEESWANWARMVEETKPDIQNDTDVIEIRELKKQIDDLKRMVQKLTSESGVN